MGGIQPKNSGIALHKMKKILKKWQTPHLVRDVVFFFVTSQDIVPWKDGNDVKSWVLGKSVSKKCLLLSQKWSKI